VVGVRLWWVRPWRDRWVWLRGLWLVLVWVRLLLLRPLALVNPRPLIPTPIAVRPTQLATASTAWFAAATYMASKSIQSRHPYGCPSTREHQAHSNSCATSAVWRVARVLVRSQAPVSSRNARRRPAAPPPPRPTRSPTPSPSRCARTAAGASTTPMRDSPDHRAAPGRAPRAVGVRVDEAPAGQSTIAAGWRRAHVAT
jgi:hypothetical protein